MADSWLYHLVLGAVALDIDELTLEEAKAVKDAGWVDNPVEFGYEGEWSNEGFKTWRKHKKASATNASSVGSSGPNLRKDGDKLNSDVGGRRAAHAGEQASAGTGAGLSDEGADRPVGQADVIKPSEASSEPSGVRRSSRKSR